MFFDVGKYAIYTPVKPQGDTDALSELYERLIIRFPRNWKPGEPVETIEAKVGTLWSGWVIGVKYIGKPEVDSWMEETAMAYDHIQKKKDGTLTTGNDSENLVPILKPDGYKMGSE